MDTTCPCLPAFCRPPGSPGGAGGSWGPRAPQSSGVSAPCARPASPPPACAPILLPLGTSLGSSPFHYPGPTLPRRRACASGPFPHALPTGALLQPPACPAGRAQHSLQGCGESRSPACLGLAPQPLRPCVPPSHPAASFPGPPGWLPSPLHAPPPPDPATCSYGLAPPPLGRGPVLAPERREEGLALAQPPPPPHCCEKRVCVWPSEPLPPGASHAHPRRDWPSR